MNLYIYNECSVTRVFGNGGLHEAEVADGEASYSCEEETTIE